MDPGTLNFPDFAPLAAARAQVQVLRDAAGAASDAAGSAGDVAGAVGADTSQLQELQAQIVAQEAQIAELEAKGTDYFQYASQSKPNELMLRVGDSGEFYVAEMTDNLDFCASV